MAEQPRVQKWLLAVRRGEHASIMAEVGRQLDSPNLGGVYAYNLACVSAQACQAAASDKRVESAQRAELAKQYGEKAIAFLGRAQAAGYFQQPNAVAHARTDSDLDPLRSRARFKEFMSRLEKAASSP
jgi:hypothetical protein